MDIDWKPLRDIIDTHQRFVLSSHVRPDADALGSELAVAELLETLGKSVRIVNPSAVPDNLKFLDPHGRAQKLGQDARPEDVADADVHLVLDTSSWVQLGDVGKVLKSSPARNVVIDHHVSSDDLGATEFKDVSAEATGALVFRMVRALDYPLTTSMATALFCAIATDTGWFRFSSTTGNTLRIVGELIDLGVQPHVLYSLLYERCSVARLRLQGRVLSRVTVDAGGRLAYVQARRDDFKETGAAPVDTEDLVNECLKIEGTECAFIAVEQYSGKVKISFRSRSDLNVAGIAEQFGGGGHKQAAGAMLDGPMPAAVDKVAAALRSALAERTTS